MLNTERYIIQLPVTFQVVLSLVMDFDWQYSLHASKSHTYVRDDWQNDREVFTYSLLMECLGRCRLPRAFFDTPIYCSLAKHSRKGCSMGGAL